MAEFSFSSTRTPETMPRTLAFLLTFLVAAWGSAAAATVPGDTFADPIPVAGSLWSWQGVLRFAGHEPGEPVHVLPVESSHTYWFQWTAPADGILGLLIESGVDQENYEDQTDYLRGREVSLGAVVYQTTGGLEGLQRLAGPDQSLYFVGATEVAVQAGATYYVVLDGGDLGTKTTRVRAFLRPSGTPAHDHLASAATLPAELPEVFTSLAGATLEDGEPGFGDWYEPVLGPTDGNRLKVYLEPAPRGGQSVWYRWEPPTKGRFAAEAWFPDNIPLIAVYRSRTAIPDWNSLDRIASVTNGVNFNRTYPPTNPGEPPSVQTFLQYYNRVQCDFDALAGETLWIQLDQLAPIGTPPTDLVWPPMRLTGTNSMGRLRIWEPAPSYDSFSHPATVTVHEEKFVTVPFASLEPGEPPMPSGANGSIWWRWTAFQDGGVELQSPLPFDAWVGESIQTLQAVPLHVLNSNAVFRAQFQATSGVTYRFRTERQGLGTSLLLVTECPHNRIEGAARIPSDGRRVGLSPGYTSVEAGEPIPRNPFSGVLWCQWDPPKTGIYEFTGAGIIDRWSFYHRTPEGLLEEIPSSEGWVDIRQLRTVWIALANIQRIQPSKVAIGPTAFESNDTFRAPRQITVPTGGTAWIEAPFRASVDPGEPSHGGGPAHASLWYEFKVPRSGSWEIEFTALEHGEVALYEGEDFGGLRSRGTWIENSASVEPADRILRFEGAEGDHLRLALDLTALPRTDFYPIERMFRILPAVPNDLPEQALPLSQAPLKGTTRGFVSDDEPLPDWRPVGSSVWYRAELPANAPGWLRMIPAGRSPDGWSPQLRVFTPDASGAWTLVGQSAMTTGTGPVIATLEPGRSTSTLWIQVLTPPGPPLEFTLELIPGLLPIAPMPDSRRLRAGTNTVWFRGIPTWAARLEQSRDLKTWLPAGDFVLKEENVGVRVPEVTPGSPMFFRGRPLPPTVLAAPARER